MALLFKLSNFRHVVLWNREYFEHNPKEVAKLESNIMQNALNVPEKATIKRYIYIEKGNSLQPISVELEVKRKKKLAAAYIYKLPIHFL